MLPGGGYTNGKEEFTLSIEKINKII